MVVAVSPNIIEIIVFSSNSYAVPKEQVKFKDLNINDLITISGCWLLSSVEQQLDREK